MATPPADQLAALSAAVDEVQSVLSRLVPRFADTTASYAAWNAELLACAEAEARAALFASRRSSSDISKSLDAQAEFWEVSEEQLAAAAAAAEGALMWGDLDSALECVRAALPLLDASSEHWTMLEVPMCADAAPALLHSADAISPALASLEPALTGTGIGFYLPRDHPDAHSSNVISLSFRCVCCDLLAFVRMS